MEILRSDYGKWKPSWRRKTRSYKGYIPNSKNPTIISAPFYAKHLYDLLYVLGETEGEDE